ncbi:MULTISPECIES: ABC transporter ATP-binding protein [Mesobacillus]|uniref:ABC transporter ATP-binding protein n=2 Tax=Mesobacillus TaxID=2675231 RepID=A0A0D6ZCY6_9BACI|nr:MULTISPECIES: ABC transporter ATP-binding protein [Mesobacillus]KIY23397.1 ABC transporter ATP-binding protein [Mesobacillus subterraneus]MDQ0413122.1 ABC-2 type transport system ATP-binding protein [Mesobacillus stamsii]
MSEITLSVKGLRKSIGKKEIIRGIDFDLKKGEVFGFLGPNGAGKTTTIRMLVGLIKPSAGSIEIGGYNLRNNFTKAMAQMGCIVENPELYSYLTGWENLEHFARMLPEVDRSHMNYVVKLVRLEERIQDPVKTYSLGMRQRLGIAQALLGKPKVLILDEPTNGLDPMGIREMRNFIRYLAEEDGLTVLVSSHLLSEIQLMCDRVAIISKGSVIKVDYVENLLAMQEKVIWQVEPREAAKEILSSVTDVIDGPDGTIITPYLEIQSANWNQMLVEKGIHVNEMNRKSPALEDLFLELTGGESID